MDHTLQNRQIGASNRVGTISPMGDVVSVAQWGNVTNTRNVLEKFASCDKFIRSRILPPPVGSVIFNFEGGKVEMTGRVTIIRGGDCEIVIRNGVPQLRGSEHQAVEMFCSIHREIELLQAQATSNGLASLPDSEPKSLDAGA
jgi:hypothetical protein